MSKYVVWNTLHTAAGHASWAVIGDTLTVRMADGVKKVELRGIDPESLARILMWEIVRDDTAVA